MFDNLKRNYVSNEDSPRIKLLRMLVPDKVVCKTMAFTDVPSYKQINLTVGDVTNDWYNISNVGGVQLFQSGKTIESRGCGITSVAMMASYLLNKAITPKDVAACFATSGDAYPGNFSSIRIKKCYNITAKDIKFSEISGYVVDKKQPVLLRLLPCGSGGKGYVGGGGAHLTGHYAVVTGVANGEFVTNDPDSRKEGATYSMNEAAYTCGVKGILMSK